MALPGLVSYGSSDESDSDSETAGETNGTSAVLPPVSQNGTGPGPSKTMDIDQLIDDDAIDDGVVGPLPASLGLPKPKYGDEERIETDVLPTTDNVSKGLSALPKSTVSKDNLKIVNDDEVEEEFKKMPKNVAIPKPPKKKGKVRITLPALPTSDSDEDEPTPKKPRVEPSSGKSGLIGMLPLPKHAAVKETNRPLVPHALTKKPAPKPTVSKAVKPPTKSRKLVEVESDSEDEDSSEFFTFADKPVASSSSGGFVLKSAPEVEERPEVPVEEPMTSHSEATYEVPEHSQYVHDEEAGASSASNSLDFETHQRLLQNEQFQRMVGKNFRSGEILDIMDVSAADQMSSSIEMTKSLTEEKSTMSYSKKRKDLPSHLSKRKHQITYLAFQAKERELELKNQWSQNRMTKRQTQAKYGF